MEQAQANQSVLVIDDSQHMDVLYRGIVSMFFGVDTFLADTGKAGLTLAKLVNPAVILLNVTSPAIDGVSTAKQLKANESTATIPIIGIVELDEADLGDAPVDDYIKKPFHPEVLVAKLQMYLPLKS